MDNQKLLKRYKIKLSVYFALFVMFSLYFIQTLFLGAQLFHKNIQLNSQFFLEQLGTYILILAPFSIIFYGIGYFFVNKNFKVIEQSIHSLEDFTSHINHEMKTPISEIISTLSLAQRLHNYEEAITISLSSAQRLSKILESIMGIASFGNISYRKEKVDIVKELHTIMKSFEKNILDKKIHLETHLHNTSYPLKLNKEHFYLCIKNILSNAIKYSNEGGKIEVYFAGGVLQILDYGIGIDKNNLVKIFQRYFRESYSSEEGFGMGMALVKQISDMNKWKLEVESEKDVYTRVTINFI